MLFAQSGPCSQVKKMFQKNRWIASVIYLTSIASTLFLSLYPWKNAEGVRENPPWVPLLIIAAVISQFLALLWYAFRQPVSRALCGSLPYAGTLQVRVLVHSIRSNMRDAVHQKLRDVMC